MECALTVVWAYFGHDLSCGQPQCEHGLMAWAEWAKAVNTSAADQIIPPLCVTCVPCCQLFHHVRGTPTDRAGGLFWSHTHGLNCGGLVKLYVILFYFILFCSFPVDLYFVLLLLVPLCFCISILFCYFWRLCVTFRGSCSTFKGEQYGINIISI